MKKSTQKTTQKISIQVPANQAKGKTTTLTTPIVEVKPFNVNDYAKDGISKDQVLQFKTAFDIFDHSGTGKVQIADIKQAFMNLGFHHQSTFAENFLSYIEKKGGGVLNFGEFIRIATAKINEEYTQPQTSLVFSAYDPKATGKFSIYDLKDTIRGIGQDIGDEEIEKMFRAADSDNDGYVTNQDFYNIVTRK